MNRNEPVGRVDVGFRVAGPPVPIDHGYPLFGALAPFLGDLHGADWLAVHPLAGRPLSGKLLGLARHRAALRLRVTTPEIPRALQLAGKSLDLDGRPLLVGTSSVWVLEPAPTLVARMVTIKGFMEEGPFAEAVRRQLEALGVKAEVDVGRRRIVTVAGDHVIGFQTRLRGLSPDDSLRVEYAGLGGRHHMGCGIFVPVREQGAEE